MKEIAHRVYKNPSWSFPGAGEIKNVFMERNAKPSLVAVTSHSLEPER
jgi:hypothetical protein